MLTYIRYALATVCFAASIGCLALWWRSDLYADLLISPTSSSSSELIFQTARGTAHIAIDESTQPSPSWIHLSGRIDYPFHVDPPARMFGWASQRGIYFPLWYPALIFAIAGVAALRLGRRFTLRSAIIATTVMAGLLGMAASL